MTNKHNFYIEQISGGFQFIRISCEASKFPTLFGIYWGEYKGRLYIPPQATITSQYISEVKEELTKLFPHTTWALKLDLSYPTYKELYEVLKEMFETAGVPVEVC